LASQLWKNRLLIS